MENLDSETEQNTYTTQTKSSFSSSDIVFISFLIFIIALVYNPSFNRQKIVEHKNEFNNMVQPQTKKEDINWEPYMKNVEKTIKQNWAPPRNEQSNRIVVLFYLSKDGTLLSKRITQSSGIPLADKAALEALEHSKFEPAPYEFNGNSIPIEFTFDYNVLTKK